MEAAFELTDADLHEVQRHRLMRRRRWGRRYQVPVVAAATALATGIVAGVLALLGFEIPPSALLSCGGSAGLFLLLVVRLALMNDRTPAVHGQLRRMTERAVKASVLGPVTIVLTPNSVKRLRAGADALEVPPRDIQAITVSNTVLALHLIGKKVLVVPHRAFKTDAEAIEFQWRVAQLAGKPLEQIAYGD